MTDFFQLQQRFQNQQQSLQTSEPLSLQESFGIVRQSLDKPTLHLPRRNSLAVQNVLSQAVIDQSRTKPILPSNVNNGKLTGNANSSPQLLAKTKLITNPLLKKLFGKDRIPIVNANDQRGHGQSSPAIRRPTPRITPRITPRTTTRITPRITTRITPRITSRTTTRTTTRVTTKTPRPIQTERPLILISPAERDEQRQGVSPGSGRGPGTETLFQKIKNRISGAEGRDKNSRREEDLMNALIQQRVEEELARRTQEEQGRQEEQRRRLLAEAAARKKQEEEEEEEGVFSLARSVVEKRQQSRTDKESPAVWAAVRALSSFVNQISSEDQVRPLDITTTPHFNLSGSSSSDKFS